MTHPLDLPEFLDETPDDSLWAKTPPAALRQALQAIERLGSGELDYVIGHASLAGLDTAVVLAVTAGGLIPLFAYVTPDIYQVLVPVAEGETKNRRSQLN